MFDTTGWTSRSFRLFFDGFFAFMIVWLIWLLMDVDRLVWLRHQLTWQRSFVKTFRSSWMSLDNNSTKQRQIDSFDAISQNKSTDWSMHVSHCILRMKSIDHRASVQDHEVHSLMCRCFPCDWFLKILKKWKRGSKSPCQFTCFWLLWWIWNVVLWSFHMQKLFVHEVQFFHPKSRKKIQMVFHQIHDEIANVQD